MISYFRLACHIICCVGQLMASGYSVLFDDASCTIKDKKSGQTIVNIKMIENKMFSFEVSSVENHALVASN